MCVAPLCAVVPQVLGLPWYGYDYPCVPPPGTPHALPKLGDDLCAIPTVPFRGASCSDAAGAQIRYADIMRRA